jgi:superfamily I DNA and/or RNA helicase
LGVRVDAFDFLSEAVHSFQGDERDVMLFSPVVSAGIGDGAINFLRRTPNLFNVAVTHARAPRLSLWETQGPHWHRT